MSWRSAVRSAVPLWVGWPAEALAAVAENKAAALRRAHVAAAAGSLPRTLLRAVRVVTRMSAPGPGRVRRGGVSRDLSGQAGDAFQMLLTGSGTGSRVRAAGWAADCQILAASKTIAIAQGSMNKMTTAPLADCASATSRPTVNRTASQRGTLRLRHNAKPMRTGAVYSLTK